MKSAKRNFPKYASLCDLCDSFAFSAVKGFLLSLLAISLSGSGKPAKQHVDKAQNNGSPKGRGKGFDVEARDHGGCQLKHQRVDDKPENSQSKNCQWQRDDLKQHAERSIHESDDQRCDKRGRQASDVKSRN